MRMPAQPFPSLNWYQRKFLHRLVESQARFLIIGGRARACYAPVKTRDLDIWADIEGHSRKGLEAALLAWSDEHPLHTPRPLQPPLQIRPGVQMKFPEFDGCAYLDEDGEVAIIDVADGVDILTSVKGLNFGRFFERSVAWHLDGFEVRVLSGTDIRKMPSKNSGPRS